jgi:hypothetical protein
MIAYVGLDLGVDTSVVTNSVAPKLHLRELPERDVEAEQVRDMQSVRQLSVLDVRPDGVERGNV